MAIYFMATPAECQGYVDRSRAPWYKRPAFNPSMPIRARFFLRVAGFLVVFASRAVTPVAAESFPSSVITEEAARPPIGDGVMSLDLSVEPSVEEGGSAAADLPDEAWHPRVEPDPWAEALADSSRLAALAPRPAPKPAYSVPINRQVQFFLDRFTRERREVVDKWFGRAGRYLEMIRDTLRD